MKGKLVFSCSMGIFIGLMTALLLRRMAGGTAAAACAGVGFAALLFLFLLLHQRWMERRYGKIEAEFQSPILFKANGNFDLGGAVKNGNIYVCEDGIVCVSLDGKPYALEELPWGSFDHISFDSVHFYIYTTDGRTFLLTTPKAEALIAVLKKLDRFE